jgi:hypothetical protein
VPRDYEPLNPARRGDIALLIHGLGTGWGEWSASLPAALNPEERIPVHIRQEAGWAPEPVWTQRLEEKSFRLCRESNLDRPVVQFVVRHFTDWATPTPRDDTEWSVNVNSVSWSWFALRSPAGLHVTCNTLLRTGLGDWRHCNKTDMSVRRAV